VHSKRTSSDRAAQVGPRSISTSASRLGGYLAVGVGAGVLGTSAADAGIINIDITSTGFDIDGVNAGVSAGTKVTKANFPFSGAGTLVLSSNAVPITGYGSMTGLYGINDGFSKLIFAAAVPPVLAKPTRFSLDDTIGSTSDWQPQSFTGLKQVFRSVEEGYYGTITHNSPDFGPGSYMGFRTQTGNYGWLNVTWTNATGEFQIYSGAYESVPGVSIAAGAVAPVPVPEPSTIAMLGAGALAVGASAIRRRRAAQRKAAASA
jgi:hypothetical protein